jgi:hypothetical protein
MIRCHEVDLHGNSHSCLGCIHRLDRYVDMQGVWK